MVQGTESVVGQRSEKGTKGNALALSHHTLNINQPNINCPDSIHEHEHYDLSRNDYLLVILEKTSFGCLTAELINLFFLL